MDSNPIAKLTELFRHFPGLGPRQAKRFVYHLLAQDKNFQDQLIFQIANLKKSVLQCPDCYRFFAVNENHQNDIRCKICTDQTRDPKLFMVVEKDVDLEAIQKAGSYAGYFFVLGGNLPLLEKKNAAPIRLVELKKALESKIKNGVKEIIIALSASTEGDHTADFLRHEITPFLGPDIKITILGRGLSTGSEIEYADAETIRNALINRH